MARMPTPLTPLRRRMLKLGDRTVHSGYSQEGKLKYWLEPSGKATSASAVRNAVRQGQIEPLDFGLPGIGGVPQSYRVPDEG